jgi:tetratricopeptide (TPR) repeat protein
VFQRGVPPDAVYAFKHALVLDAAHGSLLRSSRQQLHAQIAEALETHSPELIDTQPELFAQHYAEAGLSDKAVYYWLRAGRNAATRSANREAIAHLRRGIEAVTSLADGSEKDRIELDFQHALGPCLIATQGAVSGAAGETFARARELCEQLGDAPEYLHVLHWLGTVRAVRGELRQSLDAIEAIIALAEAREDRPALLNSLRGSGLLLLMMGRLAEARGRTEKAVAAFNVTGDAERLLARAAGQDAGVASLSVMSWALWALGYADTAAEQIVTALHHADSIGHPHTEAYACYYASILYALRGEAAEAQRQAERCLAVSEEHGFAQWRGLARTVQGICAHLTDPSSGALDELRVELDGHLHSGYQIGITTLYVLLCEALLVQGRVADAIAVLTAGLEIASRNDERIFEAELYRLKGRAVLAGGGPDACAQAQSLFGEALADEKRPGGRRFGALVHSMLASIDLDAGAEAVQGSAASAAVHGRMFAATQEEIQAAITTVAAALQHPIMRRASVSVGKGNIRREAPVLLTLEDGSIAEGLLDLAFREQTSDFDGWTVVDFKTDQEFST